MIFNEMNTTTSNEVAVQESPYELGIGGALMHVYENECNYNALMKAAALSEMKYYSQTGGDLFVQEAGAFKKFGQKVKDFFLKVIEKIKSIARSFFAKINQYILKDKDFVKKYKVTLKGLNLKGFEFKNAYKFENVTEWAKLNLKGIEPDGKVDGNGSDDQEKLNEIIEKNRASILADEGSMTEEEFRTKLREKLYGDKGDKTGIRIEDEIDVIEKSKGLIEAAKALEKGAIDAINKIITNLDAEAKKLEKEKTDLLSGEANSDNEDVQKKSNEIKGFNNKITVDKAFSNDITVFYGAVCKALADRNRQAKAICVKALSYKAKNEAAVAEGTFSGIFDGVEIV